MITTMKIPENPDDWNHKQWSKFFYTATHETNEGVRVNYVKEAVNQMVLHIIKTHCLLSKK